MALKPPKSSMVWFAFSLSPVSPPVGPTSLRAEGTEGKGGGGAAGCPAGGGGSGYSLRLQGPHAPPAPQSVVIVNVQPSTSGPGMPPKRLAPEDQL